MSIHEQSAPVGAAHRSTDEGLVHLSRVMDRYVRDTCIRLGLAPGSRMVEVSRSPSRGLRLTSTTLGSEGANGRLDRGDDAPGGVRPAVAASQGDARLVQPSRTILGPADAYPPGTFDLAYGHGVLCCQTDAVATLERIAAVVRPGGHIVLQEPVFTAPIPIDVPGHFVPAANLIMNVWLPTLLGTLGTCWDAAERYTMLCREAGLVEEDQRIFAPSLPPARAPEGLAIYRDILIAARPLLLHHAIATAEEIDRVLATLRAAQDEMHGATLFMHLHVELVARVP